MWWFLKSALLGKKLTESVINIVANLKDRKLLCQTASDIAFVHSPVVVDDVDPGLYII